MRLTASTDQPHNGQRAARLTLEDWYQAEGKPQQINGYLLLAKSSGYHPGDAPAPPEGSFACGYELWLRGTIGTVNIRAWAWNESGERTLVPAEPPAAHLTEDWQRVAGRIALPAGTKQFTLGIGTNGKQAEGAKLGWLEVDDASIVPVGFPGGELRSIWGHVPGSDREESLKQIDERLVMFQSMGLNAAFCWLDSLYLATVAGMEKADDPAAGWDGFGQFVEAAGRRGIGVHVWYSPWIYKDKGRAIELRLHPEWACVNAEGKPSDRGICLARPEVRAFELDLLRTLVERYPAIAGIHIEEPGYPWGDYCYCEYCKKAFREWFAVELKPGGDAAARHNWAAFCSTDFMARLRAFLSATQPRMMLSANGSAGSNPDWYIGRDWTTWARRGYIDFYVPQVYTESVDAFRARLAETQSQIEPWCRVVPGMAVTWSGIYPKHNQTETIQAQIAAARQAGAHGFVIFEARHVTPEEVAAVLEAVKKRP